MSLKAAFDAAVAEVTGEQTEDQGASLENTAIAAPAEPSAASDSDTGSTPRDEAGRFAAAPQAAPPSPANTDTPAAVTDPAAVAQPKVEAPAEPAVTPPQSWPTEYHDLFKSASPELQAAIARRERDVHKKLSQVDNDARSYREINEVVKPYRGEFQRRGVTEAQAFATLLNAQRILDSNPVHGIAMIAQSYGIHPQQLAQVFSQMPGPDPVQMAVHQAVQPLQQKLQTFEQREAQMEAAREQERLTAAQQMVDDFNGKHPFAAEMEGEMAHLIQSGVTADLGAAYRAALQLRPDIQAKINAMRAPAQPATRAPVQTRPTSPRGAPASPPSTSTEVYDQVSKAPKGQRLEAAMKLALASHNSR